MRLRPLRLLGGRARLPHTRRARLLAVAALVVVLAAAGLGAGLAVAAGPGVRVSSRFVTGTPEDGRPVRLDTSVYLPASTPAPAVLLTQGFGGDKSGLDTEARALAGHGYVVMTYSARGFGASGGLIHFAAPRYEVRDGERLLDYLAARHDVRHVDGRAQLAVAGASYGGAISLLLAAYDHRVDAVAADITWSDLGQALFPNGVAGAAAGSGVFTKLWAGALIGNAYPAPGAGGSPRCGRLAASVCAAYQASARTGRPTAAMLALMRAASPDRVLDRIHVPVLLTQGEQDSLFGLGQAAETARGLARHGTPVRVVWRPGGHDDGSAGSGVATDEALQWFGAVFGRHRSSALSVHQPFRFAEQAGAVSASTGGATPQTVQAAGFPGIAGAGETRERVGLAGPSQLVVAPAGGVPATVTSVPGLGAIGAGLGAGAGLPGHSAAAAVAGLPAATAAFGSRPLRHDLTVVGASTVRLTVTSRSGGDAVLFAGLSDVAPDGRSVLPAQLVSPLRVTGLRPGVPRTVTVLLPSVVRDVRAGHRLVLTVSSTNFAYDLPVAARTYRVILAGDVLTVPTVSGRTVSGGHPWGWLIGAGAIVVVAGALVVLVTRLRRRVFAPAAELADVPVAVTGLVKEYAGGYRAVDDVTFRVERGQVVGLLGPNGAGKTTALRVLVGLISPTAGTVHVFGEPVTPGAPVLARIGAFIEGPGFLPHLSGRANLRLYWAATGRSFEDAAFDVALEIAGLGASVDRRVRTYSHGMRQRLGIAQAMLGLPEVLVLDEPTNGLDPPQIAEMREVLGAYAATGRTVVVSSHLLAEVEQTCTHVVVMHRGRVVGAGSVADIAGAGGTQLVVPDTERAMRVLAAAGITAAPVPARRALEDVFLGLIGDDDE